MRSVSVSAPWPMTRPNLCGGPIVILGALSLMCSVVAGCPYESAIWLAEEASAEHLQFVLGTHRGHERSIDPVYFSVERCEPGCEGERLPVWGFVNPRADSAPPRASRVRFGSVPPGFVERIPPLPLTTGCYYVSMIGTGKMYFYIDVAGKVCEVADCGRRHFFIDSTGDVRTVEPQGPSGSSFVCPASEEAERGS